MMKLNTLNLLNENLKQHKPFKLYDEDGYITDFVYDEEEKRYQCGFGYLTMQGVVEISKDETDTRYFKFY